MWHGFEYSRRGLGLTCPCSILSVPSFRLRRQNASCAVGRSRQSARCSGRSGVASRPESTVSRADRPPSTRKVTVLDIDAEGYASWLGSLVGHGMIESALGSARFFRRTGPHPLTLVASTAH